MLFLNLQTSNRTNAGAKHGNCCSKSTCRNNEETKISSRRPTFGGKKIRWLHETLVKGRPCYKQKFYGIKTHRCIQMTPALFYCTQQCLFCWRAQSSDLRLAWDEMKLPRWDDPEEIVEGCIKEQHRILTGYKATPGVDKQT